MIGTFWHGGTLSPLARACLASFASHGHPIDVYTYDPIEPPPGVTRRDAREVVGTDDPLLALLTTDQVPMFADYFRYRLLHQRGGWWVDTDVFCLSDRLPDEPYAWAEQQPGIINNAILRLPKGDPIAERLVTLARERAVPGARWGELGPHLATEVLGSQRPAGLAGSRRSFYPLHWIEAHYLWLPHFAPVVSRRVEGALFLHCWGATLGAMGIDLTHRPPSGSTFASLMASSGLRPSSLWQRHRTRRSIRRFLNQRWVRHHWVHEFGREWRDLIEGAHLEQEALVDA